MQSQILNQWLAGVIQSLALSDALQAFHAACDKEIASMAAYKALGLDPADAPKFGWNQSERPGTRIVSNTTNIGVQPEPASPGGVESPRSNRSPLSRALPTALVAAACLLTGGGSAAGINWLLSRAPAADRQPPAAVAKPQEYDIQFRVEGGELKVDPPIPVP